ncbi:MAG: helix-turn-helix domain-containing protein [Myxococcota bacterium]
MSASLSSLLPLLHEMVVERRSPPSLAELAEAANRSPSHFQRAFKAAIRESPKQLSRRLQLELAAAALIETDASVLRIALDVGFESHEGFTRAFRAHFGQSPTQLRSSQRALRGTPHAAFLAHLGPCLSLFRATVQKPPVGKPVTYDIEILEREPETLLIQHATATHATIAEALAKALPAVFNHCATKGIAMLGVPTVVYTHWGPGVVRLAAGLPVAPDTKAEGDFEVFSYPGGTTFAAVHVGPYDSLSNAHAAIEERLVSAGHASWGPAREVYLTDPGEVPDPADWKTQILYPVR